MYGRLAYGNLNLALVPPDRRKPEDSQKAEEKLLKVRGREQGPLLRRRHPHPVPSQALDQFLSVLKTDPCNVYAANGLGAVLAELSRLDEAREIFTEVQVRGAGA